MPVGAGDLKYGLFDAISENKYRWRDTRPAKQVLGWRPSGSSDNFNPDDLRYPDGPDQSSTLTRMLR